MPRPEPAEPFLPRPLLPPDGILGKGLVQVKVQLPDEALQLMRDVHEDRAVMGAALWTIIALFPLYWTLSTSFKLGKDVTLGHLIPWVDFTPSWKGFQSLGLSPDTIFQTSTVRDEFIKRFLNSAVASVGHLIEHLPDDA